MRNINTKRIFTTVNKALLPVWKAAPQPTCRVLATVNWLIKAYLITNDNKIHKIAWSQYNSIHNL